MIAQSESIKKVDTVILIDCGITIDKDIKKLYKNYGESMMIMQHNRTDSIKIQIKEMTDLIDLKIITSTEKKSNSNEIQLSSIKSSHSLMCVILGDKYEHIMEDIVEFIPYTDKIIWYIQEENTTDVIKYMNKKLTIGNLIIMDDLMRIVRVYN